MKRSSGVLLSITSLPGPYGIGTLGRSAYEFTDFLVKAGQRFWQILPLGPTSYGDSPYQSFSTFAGNPYLIDPDMLIEDGLLKPEEVKDREWGSEPRYVDYGKIYENRFDMLRLAAERGLPRDREAVDAFVRENEKWLPDYALFMACKKHNGMRAWTEWPEDIRNRSGEALARCREEYREDIDFFTYVQYLFFKQWNKLRSDVVRIGQRITIYTGGGAPAASASTAKPAAQQAQETAPASGGSTSYTVKKGDTLSSIARKYGVSVQAIMKENNLNGSKIQVGKTLRIPAR